MRSFRALAVSCLAAGLAVTTACSGGSKHPAKSSRSGSNSATSQSGQSGSNSAAGPAPTSSPSTSRSIGERTYKTRAFTPALTLVVPQEFAPRALVDSANFLNFETTQADVKMRFLKPAALVRPGATKPSAAPKTYAAWVAYLKGLANKGAVVSAVAAQKVAGHDVTFLTLGTTKVLSGVLGCESSATNARCYGLQLGLLLRVAVIDAGSTPIVSWARAAASSKTHSAFFGEFNATIADLRFR